MTRTPRSLQTDRTAEADSVLRAKYLDYCSARIAEHLLSLSPDEIYLLAEEARGAEESRGEPLYEHMVRLATARISPPLGAAIVRGPGRRTTPVTRSGTKLSSWVSGRVTPKRRWTSRPVSCKGGKRLVRIS